jgi:hypothetical protein
MGSLALLLVLLGPLFLTMVTVANCNEEDPLKRDCQQVLPKPKNSNHLV